MRICLINIHGHLRKESSPVGGHSDTGGQITYVLSLAKYLAKKGHKVDIFTRLFKDKNWPGFDKELEKINANINIVRVACGPKGFVPKEDIWAYVSDFVEGIENYYKKSKNKFDLISTHYADSGVCGVILKARTGKPLVHTGHYLGALKLENSGITQGNFLSVNKKHSFHTRLFAERTTLNWSDKVVVYTEEEQYQQYGLSLYEGAVSVEDTKFSVVPPAVDTETFYKPKKTKNDIDKNAEKKIEKILEDSIDPSRRCLPCVFSVGRLVPRRNFLGLIEAYASNRELQEVSNLFISAGGLLDPTFIKNWEGMPTNYKTLLKDIRKLIVKNGLQGKVVLTDIFDYDKEYPGVLRYGSKNDWIYVNPAAQEHRGTAVLEAMVSGIPAVVSSYGSCNEILGDDEYVYFSDPSDPRTMANDILNLFSNHSEFEELAKKGYDYVTKNLSWKNVVEDIVKIYKEVDKKEKAKKANYLLLPARFLRKPNDKSEKDLIDDLRTFLFNVAEGKRQASKVARDLADLIIDQIKVKKKKPFIFGMVGETGSGKTTIANKLSRTLNNLGYESVIFKMDDYLKELPKDMVEKRVKEGRAVVGPNEIDIDTLNDHIKSLTKGETIVTPVINVKANSRKMRSIKGKTLSVIIIEGVYFDKIKNLDMTVSFDIDFDQLREQRYKKEDVNLYPKDDKVRTLLEDITRIENDYLNKTKVHENSDLKLNSKYEILYRVPFKENALI